MKATKCGTKKHWIKLTYKLHELTLEVLRVPAYHIDVIISSPNLIKILLNRLKSSSLPDSLNISSINVDIYIYLKFSFTLIFFFILRNSSQFIMILHLRTRRRQLFLNLNRLLEEIVAVSTLHYAFRIINYLTHTHNLQ